ncbi:hypothetical protein X777_02180 [Ooceraea biroi]|uniref:Uncharacterized protein n=1 Tax=Ooceraea biroi TaxID=2015173 RepID=A0A026WNW8_OOCBI|nr:hypothetical protein X777_02180 [Ooceraea biroi]
MEKKHTEPIKKNEGDLDIFEAPPPGQKLLSPYVSPTNHENVNLHNMHFWAVENPHWLRQIEHQRQWSLNVWCGIIDNKIIGPYFIDGHLNGNSYANFLEHNLRHVIK